MNIKMNITLIKGEDGTPNRVAIDFKETWNVIIPNALNPEEDVRLVIEHVTHRFRSELIKYWETREDG